MTANSHTAVNLNNRCTDLLTCSAEALGLFKKHQQNSTIKIPINDSFGTKETCATNMMSCYEMNPTKAFYLHPKLVNGEGQFASTNCVLSVTKLFLKTHF
jgi:hypothetical protein